MNLPSPPAMRAALIHAPGEVKMISVQRPVHAAHELLVRVESCGVCASNISPWEGRPWFQYPMPPGALGHEATGFIDQVGEQAGAWRPGQRVGFLSNHAFAEYDVVSSDAVIALPAELDGRQFPAEPLGCAMNIWQRCDIKERNVVGIVGVGFLGALLVQLACAAGARVIAFARRPFALELAAQFGAETVQWQENEAALEALRQRNAGQLCDVVIEAVGTQNALDLASHLVKERGRLVIAGYHQDGMRTVNMQLWNWRGIDVINAHERDPRVYLSGMHRAVQAVTSGQLQIEPLITHVLPLEELQQAFELTRARPAGFMKAMVTP